MYTRSAFCVKAKVPKHVEKYTFYGIEAETYPAGFEIKTFAEPATRHA